MTKNPLESPPTLSRMGGFSLIEALISFVIIAVGMLALAKFQSASVESNTDSKVRTEALNLAQSRLEIFRSLEDEAAFQARLATSTGVDATEGNHTRFFRSWSITRQATPDRAEVDVIVRWSDRSGTSQSVNLSSSISEVNPSKTGQFYVAMQVVPGVPPTPVGGEAQSNDR